MRSHEFIGKSKVREDVSRRNFLRGLGGAALAGAGIAATKDAKANSLSRDDYVNLLSGWGVLLAASRRGVIPESEAQSLIRRIQKLLNGTSGKEYVEHGYKIAMGDDKHGLGVRVQHVEQRVVNFESRFIDPNESERKLQAFYKTPEGKKMLADRRAAQEKADAKSKYDATPEGKAQLLRNGYGFYANSFRFGNPFNDFHPGDYSGSTETLDSIISATGAPRGAIYVDLHRSVWLGLGPFSTQQEADIYRNKIERLNWGMKTMNANVSHAGTGSLLKVLIKRESTNQQSPQHDPNEVRTENYKSGASFTGKFNSDGKRAEGTYKYANGDIITGTWKDGKPFNAEFTSSTGKKGNYVDGVWQPPSKTPSSDSGTQQKQQGKEDGLTLESVADFRNVMSLIETRK